MSGQVVAIIVHYGDTRRTVRSVQDHHQLGLFSDIIVVANDLRTKPEELSATPCTWLVPSRNVGFGGACQFAAMARSADIYGFFNAHVRMDENSVANCTAAITNEGVGIAAPYLYYPGRKDHVTNWRYARGTHTYSRVVHVPILVPAKPDVEACGSNGAKLIDSEWVSGAAMFCSSEVVKHVGWDGSYFISVEDVDICIRTKMYGLRVVTVPSATAVHNGESTRTRAGSTYYQNRNALWLAQRFFTPRVQALLTVYLLLLMCRLAVGDVVRRRHPWHAAAAMRGVLDAWRLWPQSKDALAGEPLFKSQES